MHTIDHHDLLLQFFIFSVHKYIQCIKKGPSWPFITLILFILDNTHHLKLII